MRKHDGYSFEMVKQYGCTMSEAQLQNRSPGFVVEHSPCDSSHRGGSADHSKLVSF